MTTTTQQAVALARWAGWIIHDDLRHADQIQIQNALLERVERLIKLARNQGLEEAKQLFPQPHQEYFGREAQDAIASLKDNTL